MSNIRRFTIEANCFEDSVSLIVDTKVMTLAMAAEINNFAGDASERLGDCKGDLIKVVARMFGAYAIRHMYEDGGADFSEEDERGGLLWTESTLKWIGEGWPDYASLGILITSASVDVPDFFNVSMTEGAAA